ncbi:hypothetical protein T261_2997 [Streptomyces lydicus]|nr:hypothetical protein T261_2997 [Streptomyces lydicus]
MKRSLALAATTIAVAGITFAGVAPANAATATSAAAKGRNCDKPWQQWKIHETRAQEYMARYEYEAQQPHPNRAKLEEYGHRAEDEQGIADAFHSAYKKCQKG